MAKQVEGKYKRIKLLLSFLTLAKRLVKEFNCLDVFGFNGWDLQKKIYEQIAKEAKGMTNA